MGHGAGFQFWVRQVVQGQLQLMFVADTAVAGARFLQFAAQGAGGHMQAVGDGIQTRQGAFLFADFRAQHPGQIAFLHLGHPFRFQFTD